MKNEKISLNMKLIGEKINNKFLELKYNFESQNKEISSKLKEINDRLDKFFLKKNLPSPIQIKFQNQKKI